jgi:hypothetical protein
LTQGLTSVTVLFAEPVWGSVAYVYFPN